MSNPVNTITIESLREKELELSFIRSCIDQLIKYEPNNEKEEALVQYIKMQKASAVSEYMNRKGYRVNSSTGDGLRKYTPTDITSLFDNSNKMDGYIDPAFKLAKALFNYNKGKATWNTILKTCKEIFEIWQAYNET